MPEADLFLLFVRPLNRAQISYVLTGSIAAIFYGEPRLTHDVDFVVLLNQAQIAQLTQVFAAPDFYCPPGDIIELETKRENRGHFNIIHVSSGFKADFYVVGIDSLNQWVLANPRELQFEGERIRLAPPEYVIVRKLEYYREGQSQKHLRDIRSILQLAGEKLDHALLNQWIQRLGLQAEWLEVS